MPLGFLITGGVLFALFLYYRRIVRRIIAMPQIPDALPPTGFEVPVFATFVQSKPKSARSFKSYNSMFPSMRIFEDRVECQVVRKRVVAYRDIEKVEILDAPLTRNLCLHVKNDGYVLMANLLNHRNLSRVLMFLKKRGLVLSQGAETFMATHLA